MEENQSKLLINLVRSFPELYDDKNEQYKYNAVRENAWKTIAARLHSTRKMKKLFCVNYKQLKNYRVHQVVINW